MLVGRPCTPPAQTLQAPLAKSLLLFVPVYPSLLLCLLSLPRSSSPPHACTAATCRHLALPPPPQRTCTNHQPCACTQPPPPALCGPLDEWVVDYYDYQPGRPDDSVFETPQLCQGVKPLRVRAPGTRAARSLRMRSLVPAVKYGEEGGRRGGREKGGREREEGR